MKGMNIKVKLCGMMRDCDIDYANEAMPDYVGFIFADTRRRISREQARSFRGQLKKEITAVGVFVDESPEIVAGYLNDGIIEIAQLHGAEDEFYIERLRALAPGAKLIKAARVKSTEDIRKVANLSADYLLLDAMSAVTPGGTGSLFDWSLIDEAKTSKLLDKPWFLAGGICADNIPQAALQEPYGLDISSGIETAGAKDREKMIEVVRSIRRLSNV